MNDYYGQEQLAKMQAATSASIRQPTLREIAMQRIENAQSTIRDSEELLKLLDANPDMQRILDLLGHRY